MTTTRIPGPSAAVTLVVALALTACEVTNPGPVQDQFLDLAEAHQALVNGAAAKMAQATGYTGLTGGFAAREIFPTGQCCGHPNQNPSMQAGSLQPESASQWEAAHQARWIAEDAIRRFKALGTGKVNADIFAQAYLWAGYANRLLGENMCDAVFNGGPKQSNSEYFKRAEQHFTDAIAVGSSNFKTAGYAGRAAVRVWLKNWSGAVSDAQLVPLAFVYQVTSDVADEATRNAIFYTNSNAPYRSYTFWQTWFDTYFKDTGDPRTQIATNPSVLYGNGSLTGFGPNVPWSYQLKYTSNAAPYRLSSGREMVLIRAEALLTIGDRAGAMTLINSLRTTQISRKTNQPLAPWPAANMTEAWTALKRERAIELWLEARRLGDLRRWDADKIPGSIDWPNFEAVSVLFRDNPPSKCFPIPFSEIDTNPNI